MMIGAAGFVLPCEVICCYIFDEVGGDGGDEIGGWQREEWEGGRIERDGTGRGIPRKRDESVLIVSVVL